MQTASFRYEPIVPRYVVPTEYRASVDDFPHTSPTIDLVAPQTSNLSQLFILHFAVLILTFSIVMRSHRVLKTEWVPERS